MTPVVKKGVLALEMHDILLAPMSQVRTFYVALLPDFYFRLVTFCPYLHLRVPITCIYNIVILTGWYQKGKGRRVHIKKTNL